MIITQTPLRIGLLGGGTDLPDYYREHGGRVLNCAIDKYIYVIVKQRFDQDIYVNYSKKEIVSRVEDLEHELVREAMWMTGVTNGVEITTLADIPSAGGSGLGSSSAVTVGLLGGGTDLPDYYREHGGRVLNCAIDKYLYVIVKQRFDDDIYVNYSKKEIVSRVEDLEHELVREAMWMTGVTNGVEITTLADIPSAGGSGLGSSSAVTVGLLHALFAYRGRQVTAEELADRACIIELDRCGKPIGKQDQYIAALGGIRDIRFGPGDQVMAEELELPAATRRELQRHIMLFYTGVTRSANSILAEQTANIKATHDQLDVLRDLAGLAADRLRCGDVDALGEAMRKGWEAKRQLATGISNPQIDTAIDRALEAGATGAKLTGAGGGGFLLVICPAERQRAVRESLADMAELPVKLDRLGSRIVLNVTRDIWG